MKRICELCRSEFKCNGECEKVVGAHTFHITYERKDACYCPECAKEIIDEYSDKIKQVCPRFNKLNREKVIFT